jgi:catechol 2,3-dioxygenase-like lactoylglutathione lyase family enzyme
VLALRAALERLLNDSELRDRLGANARTRAQEQFSWAAATEATLRAYGEAKVGPDLTHLAFEVTSLEDFGKHLESLGRKYSDGPHYKPDGSGGFAFVDAPEGYEVELIQRSPVAVAGGILAEQCVGVDTTFIVFVSLFSRSHNQSTRVRKRSRHERTASQLTRGGRGVAH